MDILLRIDMVQNIAVGDACARDGVKQQASNPCGDAKVLLCGDAISILPAADNCNNFTAVIGEGTRGGTKGDSVKNAVKQEPNTSARSPAVIKYHNNAKSSSAGADTCKVVNYEMQKRHLEHEILKTNESLKKVKI